MSKTARNILIALVALFLLAGTFSGGVLVGFLLPNRAGGTGLPFLTGTSSTSTTPQAGGTDLETLFKPFWETWNIVHKQYVDQPVNDLKLMRGAISGMLSALDDPHTSYMDPDMYSQANAPLEGSYEGIGAYVDTSGKFLVITNPMKDSPAEKAGLKPGDVIIQVDGEDMTGIEPSVVLRKVLGPAGSTVKLSVQREGNADLLEFSIVRGKINMPSVQGKMLDNNVAYLQLFTFGGQTPDELRKELQTLLDQKPKGLILDLRNNGGGYLNTAVDVVSEFIDKGQVVMYEQFGDGSRRTYKATSGGLATKIPLVVLVNENSASASEITAGALQDYARAKLVGVTTYGKGTVQNWIALQDDQGAVRVTIARWLTPKERSIHKIGLTPDVEVKITEDDMKADRDPQLDKAIQVLLEQIK